MKLNIFGLFTAEGTTEQLAEYTALVMLILKNCADKKEHEQIQKDIESIWEYMQKGGESNGNK